MNVLKKIVIPVTTDGAGNATILSNAIDVNGIHGYLNAIAWQQGTISNGATLTVAGSGGGFDTNFLSMAVSGNLIKYPRPKPCDSTGTDIATVTSLPLYVIDGNVKVTISGGGATNSGSVVVTWTEDVKDYPR